MKKILSFFLLTYFVSFVFAFNINRYGVNYKTIKSEHFDVFFKEGREKLANYIANIAEEAYLRHKNVFKLDLKERTPIIIKSFDEYSFGDADPFSDQIVLNEYFNVYSDSGIKKPYDAIISHELAHIFTFKFLSKKTNIFRRTIALGFMPLWMIEGIAQFLGEEWYDSYEGYMINVAISNSFLSMGELNSFYYANSLGRHRGYIESFAFTRYLFHEIGDKNTFYDFLLSYSKDPFNIEKSFHKVFKKGLNELFAEFKLFWKQKSERINRNNLDKFETLPYELTYMRYPKFSHDGKILAFIGDNNAGFNIRNHLYFYDFKNKTLRKVLENIDPYYSFSEDNRYLLYSHIYFSIKNRRFLYDLFIYDIEKKTKRRITKDFSARFPCFIDNKTIAFVRYDPFGDGLYKMDLESGKMRKIIDEGKGYYFFDLRPYGKNILASCFEGSSRQIVKISEDDKIIPITNFNGDNRYIRRTGEGIYFKTTNGDGISRIVEIPVPDRKDRLSDITNIDKNKFLWLDKLGYSISEFDVSKNKLALTYFSNGKYMIRLYDLNNVSSEKFKFTIFPENKDLKLSLVDYKIDDYKKKIHLDAITPWLEYYDEWKIGILASFGDFLGFNNIIGKVYYNLKSKRIGEKVTLVSKSLPFTTNISYENDVIRSRYGSSMYIKRKEGIDLQFDYPFNPWEEVFWGAITQNISSVRLDPIVYPLPFSGRINLIKFGYKYFKLRPSPDWDINPSGGKYINIQFRRADELIKSDIDYSEIRAIWNNYISINHLEHTLVTKLSYGNKYHISNINTPILFGIGGVDTVRGFSTDTRFGTKYAIASTEYRLPLKLGIIKPRIGYFYLNKLFASVFYDSGNAWYNGKIKYSDFLTSYGTELKLKSLLLGKVPIITRLGYAIKGRNGNGSSTYMDFDIPIF